MRPAWEVQFGRENNAVEWGEEMYNITTGLYGTTGMFFHLNRSYKFPPIHPKDYNTTYVEPIVPDEAAAEADNDIEYESGNETEGSDADTVQGEGAPSAAPIEEFTEQFINKLREGAYDCRQKSIEQEAVNETKIWALMWAKMSPASQSKVREGPRFDTCTRLHQ